MNELRHLKLGPFQLSHERDKQEMTMADDTRDNSLVPSFDYPLCLGTPFLVDFFQ